MASNGWKVIACNNKTFVQVPSGARCHNNTAIATGI